ncbi:MAG: type II toxin-antitoxin system HicB family antitoxin [Bdellovibrionales bacterium]|nr:type II toxin-antitoxin system HicB family antitoxin [Bdellovibrionales bacterium]
MRQIIIKPGEDGFWLAECPSLPGCISQGQSKKEAIKNIQEAVEGYIEVLQQDGEPIPEDNMESVIVAI